MTEMNDIIAKKINVNGLGIMYYRCGNGERTIVLAHGAGADRALLSWWEVMPLLATHGYTVIAPDLPGYGSSDRIGSIRRSGCTDDGQAYSLPFYTEFILAFMKRLGLRDVALCGLSLGGGVTLAAALDDISFGEPRMLRAIIPVDAWGLADRLPWHRFTYYYVRSPLNRVIFPLTAHFRPLVRYSLQANLFGDKSKVTDALVDEVLKTMCVPNVGEPFRSFQLAEITSRGLSTNLYDQLPKLSLPVLLVHGSRDAAVPLKDALAARERIPGAQLYVMEDCRHWPQKERPEEFVSAVAGFLAGI
jgi:pimeloyl-ACP methyl ester carboxylesterase